MGRIPDQILPDTPAPSHDGYRTVSAATTHDASSVAITDALISARAVIADLAHHTDTDVINAARVVAHQSTDRTEQSESIRLIALLANRCPRCGGRGVTHWHPHWDNGHSPCPSCTDDQDHDTTDGAA